MILNKTDFQSIEDKKFTVKLNNFSINVFFKPKIVFCKIIFESQATIQDDNKTTIHDGISGEIEIKKMT